MTDLPYRVDKPWGYELIWAKTDRYAGKVLHIDPGHVLSLQYHNTKDESIYVLAGEIILRIQQGDTLIERRLGQGAADHIHPKLIHQFEAGVASDLLLARPFGNGPVLIIFVDTLFDADLSLIRTVAADGILWAKEVEDYQRFGVIVTDQRGYMQSIVEKPSTPVSRLANIGLYYIKDWKTLFDGIAHVLKQPPGKGGEDYLTDPFQYMVDRGRRLFTAPVGGWYDCGKVDTLLQTNRNLLHGG